MKQRMGAGQLLRSGAIVLLLGVLGACAVSRPMRPAATPVATETATLPANTPVNTPAIAAPTARAPDVRVLAPDNYPTALAQQRRRLSGSGRDVLARDDVGYYLDVQQARLKQFGSDQLQVTRELNQIRLTLAGPGSFEVGSARLTPDSAAMLTRIAEVLRDYRQSLFSVHGHTDNSGDTAANLRLSQHRALTVARLLVEHGVGRERVVAVGHGQSMPIADNGTDAGRERNRRVELVLDPLIRAD